jgi:hypothetical protein
MVALPDVKYYLGRVRLVSDIELPFSAPIASTPFGSLTAPGAFRSKFLSNFLLLHG